MWTKLMVRLWAIKNEPKYRVKAIRNMLIFFSTLYICCEVSLIGEWGLGDIAIMIGSFTMLIYLGSGLIKKYIKEVKVNGYSVRNYRNNEGRDRARHSR